MGCVDVMPRSASDRTPGEPFANNLVGCPPRFLQRLGPQFVIGANSTTDLRDGLRCQHAIGITVARTADRQKAMPGSGSDLARIKHGCWASPSQPMTRGTSWDIWVQQKASSEKPFKHLPEKLYGTTSIKFLCVWPCDSTVRELLDSA